MELINKGFTYEKGRTLYSKGIQCVDDIQDNEQRDFLTWDRAREKFNLTPTHIGDWRLEIGLNLQVKLRSNGDTS